MTTDIEFENGEYGLRAVLKSAWSEATAREIAAHNCYELEVNYAKGWRGEDLSFLRLLPWLKALKIIDLNIKSVEPIHALGELRTLSLTTYCHTPIRFSAFPLLKECALEWREGSSSLFDCVTLTRLLVSNYVGNNLALFSHLVGLEHLALLGNPAESLYGIESLVALRTLRLANLKKLLSLSGIEHLKQLEELEINTCPKISSIIEIGSLPRLRKLYLNNNGNIDSLKPIDAISSLESVLFYESTNIIDGDLYPLTRQKNLCRVSFQNRRHYSHKREDFGAAYSALPALTPPIFM